MKKQKTVFQLRIQEYKIEDLIFTKGVNMINFDEEIAKFQPSLEVDQAEEVIHSNDLSDITDIIKTMLKEIKDRK